jgi:hypothetical protein
MTKVKSSLLAAATLVMGVVLTSCINSKNDYVLTDSRVAKMSGFMGVYEFQTSDGVTITPTSRSIAQLQTNGGDFGQFDGKVCLIYYQWDSSVVDINTDSKVINGVDLIYVASLDHPVEIVEEPGAPNDSVDNMPIISLSYEASSLANYEPAFFDRNTVLLPIRYYVKLSPHTFTLCYYPNEIPAEETEDKEEETIRFYLRHNKQKDTPDLSADSYMQASNYGVNLYYFTFDLTAALDRYEDETGKPRPTKIEIETRENSYTVNNEDPSIQTKVYTVEYKPQTN